MIYDLNIAQPPTPSLLCKSGFPINQNIKNVVVLDEESNNMG